MLLNILSVLVGIVALLFALPALIPFLGWINYLVIPVAIVGVALGVLSGHKTGRNLNILVIVIGVVRLFLGGGLL